MASKKNENPVNARPATAARKAPAPRLHKKATPVSAPVVETVSHEDIARLAYALWEARGGGGSPEEDWLRAEEQLREKVSAAAV